jgi:cysteine-rich repeat protein
MSHRWLIAVSMGAHLAVAGGLFVAGVWRIERMEGRRRFDGIGVLLPPPAPSGGPVAAKPLDFKPKEKKHPPPVMTQPTTATTALATSGAASVTPGPGPGPGTPDDVGKCLENCGESVPVEAVCGNGSLEAGEQCDDGNTLDGDGCSPTCRIEVKPKPKPTPLIAPNVLQGLRISGETQVHPGSATQQMMMRDGASRVVGTVKLCISIDGGVASAATLVSTKYPDYDAMLLSAVRGWRYRPYTLDDAPVAACSSVTFIYTIK